MAIMTIRGILFDKDGTLIDFPSTWTPVLQALALEFAKGDARAPATSWKPRATIPKPAGSSRDRSGPPATRPTW
jgi:phosphoglycolate phosphatase-like HAD superfamily hydrolase